jgi:O-antigen/teichoic acid export membrane protein
LKASFGEGKASMNLTERTLSNGAWQFSLVAFRTIAQLGVIAVLARLLTPEDFGLVAIANVTIGFVAMFTRFGLGQALVQRKDLTERHVRVSFTIAILSAVLLAGLLIISAPLVSSIFRNQSVTPVLRVLSLSFVLVNLGTVAEFLLIRDLAFDRLFRATVLTFTLGYSLAGISLALMGFGAWALVGATLATDLVSSIALTRLQPHSKRLLLSKKELKELIHFGGGITLANLANYLANTGDYFIVGRWLGAASLGIYQQAFNVMLLPAKYLGDVLDRVLFASASLVQEKSDSLAKGYRQSTSVVNLILMPLSVMMIVLAPEIILTLFGSKWQEAILPLQILLISVTFRTMSRISDAFIHAVGAVYDSALRKYIYAALLIAGSIIALPWGIVGVAVAVTLAALSNYFLIVKLGLRLTSIKWQDHLLDLSPGMLLSVVILAPTMITVNYLRGMISLPLITLIISLFVALGTVIGFTLIFPQAIGSAGNWLLKEMMKLSQNIVKSLRHKLC